MSKCGRIAAQGLINTFDIRPTHAATNYGYIRAGRHLNGALPAASWGHSLKNLMQRYGLAIADHYLWNSGNFLF